MFESMPDAGDDPEQQAMQRYLVRVANTIEDRVRPTRTDGLSNTPMRLFTKADGHPIRLD
jgi:hypothetical protein